METINDNNYELWLVRYADGGLTAVEHEAVEQWLEQHPDAAEELALYNEAPRLERDESIRYVAVSRQHTRPLWGNGWRWAAAAAVALILLTPAAIHLFSGMDEPVQVARVVPTVPTEAPQEVRTAPAAPTPAPATSPAVRRPGGAPVEDQLPLEAIENYIPSRPMATEPVLLADAMTEEDSMAVETEEPMVYVTNLFVEDTTSELEQRLLTLNDAIKERLQGSYLGRRLARRLPEDEELLARVDSVRERTPRGIRIVTDLVVKLIEVNSKENNQQNSITL